MPFNKPMESGNSDLNIEEFIGRYFGNREIRGYTIFHLSCFVRHNFVSSEVRLVANKKLVYILTGITVNFTQPLLHVVEALLVCHVIDYLQHAPKLLDRIHCTRTWDEILTTVLTEKIWKKEEEEEEETYYNAMCPTVVATSNCPKTFLSSSVPLQVSREQIMKNNSNKLDGLNGSISYNPVQNKHCEYARTTDFFKKRGNWTKSKHVTNLME